MELSISDLKELISALAPTAQPGSAPAKDIAADMLGKYVIIRTDSAGVWAGTLAEKSGNEVILKDARRLWYWKAVSGISLSAVATVGIDPNSKITQPVEFVWLEAIEIIPLTPDASTSIKGAPNAKAE